MIYGIDIGGSKIEIAVFDHDLVSVEKRRIATPTNDYESFVAAIIDLIARADDRFGRAEAVGLGIPGLVDDQGRSLSSNVPHATGRPVAADVMDRIGRAVASENDCRCFALSEAHGGAGEGRRVVFGAILGTGAAGGLVVDGALVRGRQGIAGEYGHFQLPASLAARYGLPVLRCGCGLAGCFETYIAGAGVTRLARHFGVDAHDVPVLVARWRAGEDGAIAARECLLDLVGAALASVVMTVDPDVIVMGGGLSLVDELVGSLPDAIDRHLFMGFTPPPVVAARFGDASGARGAAIVAWRGASAR